MRFFIIVLVCTLVVVSYGIVHDQITIRVSPEYFTVGHPTILETSSMTVLALAWGTLTSGLAGIPFGFLVASAACHGRRLRPIGLPYLYRRLGYFWIGLAIGAALFGLGGFLLAWTGMLTLPPDLAVLIEPTRHTRFLAVWSAHVGSYTAGGVGTLALTFRIRAARGWS